MRDLEARLTRALGTKVEVRDAGNEGEIAIPYADLDALDRLLDKLLHQPEPCCHLRAPTRGALEVKNVCHPERSEGSPGNLNLGCHPDEVESPGELEPGGMLRASGSA